MFRAEQTNEYSHRVTTIDGRLAGWIVRSALRRDADWEFVSADPEIATDGNGRMYRRWQDALPV